MIQLDDAPAPSSDIETILRRPRTLLGADLLTEAGWDRNDALRAVLTGYPWPRDRGLDDELVIDAVRDRDAHIPEALYPYLDDDGKRSRLQVHAFDRACSKITRQRELRSVLLTECTPMAGTLTTPRDRRSTPARLVNAAGLGIMRVEMYWPKWTRFAELVTRRVSVDVTLVPYRLASELIDAGALRWADWGHTLAPSIRYPGTLVPTGGSADPAVL